MLISRRLFVAGFSLWATSEVCATFAPTAVPTPEDTVSIGIDFLVSVGSASSVTADVFRTSLSGHLAGASADTDLINFVLPNRRRLDESVGTTYNFFRQGQEGGELGASLPSPNTATRWSEERELVSYAVSFNVVSSLAVLGFADANMFEVALEEALFESISDGSLETAMLAACGCSQFIPLSFYLSQARAYPTLRPTPLPSPEPSFQPTPLPISLPTKLPTLIPSGLPTPVPSLTPTAVSFPPTSAPTLLPSITPVPTVTPAPSAVPTQTPTPKPTDYRINWEAMRPGSASKKLLEAVVITLAFALVGCLLSQGDKWMEEERLQKKLDKILETRLLRKRLRKILMQTAADEDLLETVEVFKEKYYPGDRVIMLGKKIPKRERLRMKKAAENEALALENPITSAGSFEGGASPLAAADDLNNTGVVPLSASQTATNLNTGDGEVAGSFDSSVVVEGGAPSATVTDEQTTTSVKPASLSPTAVSDDPSPEVLTSPISSNGGTPWSPGQPMSPYTSGDPSSSSPRMLSEVDEELKRLEILKRNAAKYERGRRGTVFTFTTEAGFFNIDIDKASTERVKKEGDQDGDEIPDSADEHYTDIEEESDTEPEDDDMIDVEATGEELLEMEKNKHKKKSALAVKNPFKKSLEEEKPEFPLRIKLPKLTPLEQEQKRLQDEKNRERARSAGIKGGELKGELSKKLRAHNVVGVMTPLDVKVLQTYPNRDWDDEELNELANGYNPLLSILIILFRPFFMPGLRKFIYECCCGVSRHHVIKAGIEDGDNEETIDGYPKDCGTKETKHVSRAKCTVVTAQNQPHQIKTDAHGEAWVSRLELYREAGQHNLECSAMCDRDTLVRLGCRKEPGYTEEYGIGMSLYFKFMKTMTNTFMGCSLLALFSIFYYWSTSAWNDSQKMVLVEALGLIRFIFFTSAGSLGGRSYVCGSGWEGDTIHLDCMGGMIQRLEAYYGDPEGTCSCPPAQEPEASTGECPADPSFSNYSWGECLEVYRQPVGTAAKGDTIPCFLGNMWNGDACCSSKLHDSRQVNLDSLAGVPNPMCNSGSAQFIAQAFCLNQGNCTIDVLANNTYSWEVAPERPCGEGVYVWDRYINAGQGGLICTTTLSSATSNYTDCPDESKRRFFVRGQCGVADFSIPYYEEGQIGHSREMFGKFASWLDALIVGGLFVVCLWLSEKQLKSIVENDVGRCSVDDYTLRIMFLPKLKTGKRSDLNALRRNLILHFENLLSAQKSIIPGRPRDPHIHVVDVNFGNNDQEKIRLMRKRGNLALQLDLEKEKLVLLRTHSMSRGFVDTKKQEKRVSESKVKFLEVAEAVNRKDEILQARTAFITFASEEGFQRACAIYNRGFIGRMLGSCWCTAPSGSLYKGKHVLDVRTVMRPSDYIWENFSVPPVQRVTKVCISNIISLLILIFGFAVIIKAKGIQSEATMKQAATADCSMYEYKYSGDPSWESTVKFDNDDTTSNKLSRLDISYNVYADFYNNSYPDDAMLGCFCLWLESSEEYSQQTSEVALRNPGTGLDEYLCSDFFSEYTTIEAMSTLAVFTVVVVNELLKSVFGHLVEFEGHETETEQILAHCIKLFGTMMMNTGLLVLLISGNLDYFTGGKQGLLKRVLSFSNLMSGSLSELDMNWYLTVGSSICYTMIINTYTVNTKIVKDYVQINLTRCLDRGCTFDMSRTKAKIQLQLENLYTGPKMQLQERYASLFVIYFVCVIFSPGMPFLWIAAAGCFFFTYIIERWAFLRMYRLPPKYGSALAETTTEILPLGILAHVIFAAWTFSSPALFDYEVHNVPGANNTAYVAQLVREGRAWANQTILANATNVSAAFMEPVYREDVTNALDYWEPDRIPNTFSILRPLKRIANHANSLPHIILFFVWIGWFIATKVMNLDYLIRTLLSVCSPDDESALPDMLSALAAANKLATPRKSKPTLEDDVESGLAPSGAIASGAEEAKDEPQPDDLNAGKNINNRAEIELTTTTLTADKTSSETPAEDDEAPNTPVEDGATSKVPNEGGAPTEPITDADAGGGNSNGNDEEVKDDDTAFESNTDNQGGGQSAASESKASSDEERSRSRSESGSNDSATSSAQDLRRDPDDVVDASKLIQPEDIVKSVTQADSLSATAKPSRSLRPPKPKAKALKSNTISASGGGSAYMFGLRTEHVDTRPPLVSDNDPLHRCETTGPGGRRVLACAQENFKASEAARYMFDFKVGFLTRNVREDEESEDPSDSDDEILEEKPLTRTAASMKAKQLNKRFNQFFDLYCRESGSRGLQSFFPHVEENDEFVPDICASYEYRDHELTRLEALWAFREKITYQNSRRSSSSSSKKKMGASISSMSRQKDGQYPAQAFEGNVDYLWAIKTSQLEDAIKQKLLRKSVLALYTRELAFRMMYPEMHARVKRTLQGLVSFDINANIAYVTSFALESPSLLAYQRGQFQVTGEDYEAAGQSRWQKLKACLLGPPPLPVVYPNATQDMPRGTASHVTCVGVNPARVRGPRLVVTLKVPPKPDDLTDQLKTDPAYDDGREKFQYLRIKIGGKVEYTVQLPRGLQHQHLPEIQFEIPAIEFHEDHELEVEKRHHKTLKKKGLAKYVEKDVAHETAAKEAAERAEATGDLSQRRSHLDAIAGMQRFHLDAPERVQLGNRVDVAIRGCGKLQVQWPHLALPNCPVQIHLPAVRVDRELTHKEVVAAQKRAKVHAHKAEVAARAKGEEEVAPTRAERARELARRGVFARLPTPSCHVVKPDNILEHSETGYSRDVEQQGWAQLMSPLDEGDEKNGEEGRREGGLGNPLKFSSERVALKVQQLQDEVVVAQRAHLRAKRRELPSEASAAQDLAKAIAEKDRVLRRARRAAYRKFYADYTRHRVLYQLMVFAPKCTVKDFSNLRLFQHDIVDLLDSGSVVATLRPGRHLGGRIGLTVPLDRSLPMDGQCAEITVPSVGSIKVRVIASNYCHLKGLHGIPVLGLGVLPWDEKPLERREVVPENISEVNFDFPAITKPSRRPKDAPTSKYMQHETFLKPYLLKAPRRRQVQDIRQFNAAMNVANDDNNGGNGGAEDFNPFGDKNSDLKIKKGMSKAELMTSFRDKLLKKKEAQKKKTKSGSNNDDDEDEDGNDDRAEMDDALEEEIVLPKLGKFDVAWPTGLQRASDHMYCAAADAKDKDAGSPFSKDVQIDRHAYVHDKRFRPCLRFGFPVLKGGKDVPRELMEFTRMPPPNKDLAEHGRRYQVGWVLIELPTMEPPPPPYVDLAAFSAATGGVSNGDSENAESAAIASQAAEAAKKEDTLRTGRAGYSIWEQKHRPSLKIYLRVPAYVTHTTRSLSRLPLNDTAALGARASKATGRTASGGAGSNNSGANENGENGLSETVERLKREIHELREDLAEEEDEVNQLSAANAKLEAKLNKKSSTKSGKMLNKVFGSTKSKL